LVSSLLLAYEACGGERICKEELRVLEVIGLYSVDGKSKPSMMFDNVAARAGVV
jgi:hypothetical protein